MKTETYLHRLSRMAHWLLSPGEATEVIDDYTELLSTKNRSDTDLYRDFGTPYHAVRLVCPLKPYLHWLAVFIALTFLLLFPVIWVAGSFSLTSDVSFVMTIQLAAAEILLLWWFRKYGGKQKFSYAIPIILGIIMIIGFCEAGFLWYLQKIILSAAQTQSCFWIGSTGHISLKIIVIVCGILGIYGLINARLHDRRWCAVYIVSFTLTALCITVLQILTSMNLEPEIIRIWSNTFLFLEGRILAIGLIGTVVALC